ncbi:MAG: hypothetical protein Q7T03_01200 [Deltaproteobacteria bacterium]|nr:hypothetical protein [Deltaproteobacteria bacterium]
MKRYLSLSGLMILLLAGFLRPNQPATAQVTEGYYVIDTVAGSGQQSLSNGGVQISKDGVQALLTDFNSPQNVAIGPDSLLLVVDTANNRIRKIGADGIIATVAGGAPPIFGADGRRDTIQVNDNGLATQAILSSPNKIAFDKNGNMFIADTQNLRIRKVDAVTQIITTIAGGGNRADADGNTRSDIGDNGPTKDSLLNQPYSIAFGSDGSLYIADSGNNRIRKVQADENGIITPNSIISTLAGKKDAEARVSSGYFNSDGSSPENKPAGEAFLGFPTDIVFDNLGNLYVVEFDNSMVRKIGPDGNISLFAGKVVNGRPTYAYSGDGDLAVEASLNNPYGAALDAAGNLYIADSHNYRIRKVDNNGVISTIAGQGNRCQFSGDGWKALEADFCILFGLAIDKNGGIYIADAEHQRIRKLVYVANPVEGYKITTIVGRGSDEVGVQSTGKPLEESLASPYGLALSKGGILYIADDGHNLIKMLENGVVSTIAGVSGLAGDGADGVDALTSALSSPAGLALDISGYLYVADSGNHKIRRLIPQWVDRDGARQKIYSVETVAGDGQPGFSDSNDAHPHGQLNNPTGLFVAAQEHALYIADTDNNRIRKLDLFTGLLSTVTGDEEGLELNRPESVVARSFDIVIPERVNAADLYIYDIALGRIRYFDGADGILKTVIGGDDAPIQMELNGFSGLLLHGEDLYVSSDNKIFRFNLKQNSSEVIAGTGELGFSGDGGPALEAGLRAADLVMEETPVGQMPSTIYFSDDISARVRKLSRAIFFLAAAPVEEGPAENPIEEEKKVIPNVVLVEPVIALPGIGSPSSLVAPENIQNQESAVQTQQENMVLAAESGAPAGPTYEAGGGFPFPGCSLIVPR